MEKQRFIVALGGNAILTDDPSAKAQQKALQDTTEKLSVLVEAGHEVIISHGNGPQVGNLLLQQLAADSPENPAMPLDTLVSMTQGSIGYWLQNALQKTLQRKNIDKEVATVLTQVVVDENDPAFSNPSKPIGPFLTEEEANNASDEDVYIEDAGRGWRKVVPSPRPVNIKESKVIESMVEAGFITVAAGGGGIPVINEKDGVEGVEAVIDKDFASAKLAELVKADTFIILTGVDNVYINFNKPNQKKLEEVTVAELEQYIKEDQFAPGSMLPKVEAAIEFVKNVKNGKTVITSLENIANALENDGGTTVVLEE
ncbi:carbamate kinase [Alkalibacterium kapii]|uniref:Carbamate kinase n=1 Tax=Alkalibacterium kapii TaxID=426704 RepID=A0A511ASV1_9LACT|nr:carbamate kinase [Alkalibacterium kapii]GEK91274.1 carbamate kinase [Alkalibacterium kapii]